MNTVSATAKRMPKVRLLATIDELQRRLVAAGRVERYLRERLYEETGNDLWISLYREDR